MVCTYVKSIEKSVSKESRTEQAIKVAACQNLNDWKDIESTLQQTNYYIYIKKDI